MSRRVLLRLMGLDICYCPGSSTHICTLISHLAKVFFPKTFLQRNDLEEIGCTRALLTHPIGSEILKPAIACGITTCLDMHNTPDDIIRLKKDCATSVELPDLKSAFYGATIEGGWPKPIVLHLDPSPEVGQQSEQAVRDNGTC